MGEHRCGERWATSPGEVRLLTKPLGVSAKLVLVLTVQPIAELPVAEMVECDLLAQFGEFGEAILVTAHASSVARLGNMGRTARFFRSWRAVIFL